MTRRITYAIRSENGRYNASFRWDLVQHILNFASRYWDIAFVRVNGGERFSIIQSARSGPGWMWAQKSKLRMYVHPSVNWGRSAGDCASAVLHEFCHLAGSGNHLLDPMAMMHAGGGICDNYIAADYSYMSPYAWRGALRPASEPKHLRETFKVFSTTVSVGEFDLAEPPENCMAMPRCGCKRGVMDLMAECVGKYP